MSKFHFAFLLMIVAVATCCKTGWLTNGNSCYFFSHDTENWIGALQLCRELGGKLVEIETEAENTFIKSQESQFVKDRFWIALSDVEIENTWIWMNSKVPLSTTGFSDWFPGQPDNNKLDQNCASFHLNKTSGNTVWHWDDVPCMGRNHYICEALDSPGNIVG
ncbi:mannose binding [Mactra antiquata]